ncbi:uncharacterized protein PFL1_04050 [Pseudozyma flocculosa PF-1]|uniref:Protein YOP1 n=1 Tax=Pseudozyma flocculosa PF-1 TaxID=1277687 RepID=A0A061H6G4_9BASI|nr:uncharacterized protein PFL1_04050 [Pseudozyma flocculosa PF-1]EPQ28223.1 hypothetical protein PFL1_04050 [Pseudozyma flocculosa PF-1]
MTLTDLVLKAIILLFCLRDTFDALRTPHLADLGRSSKPSTRAVRARDAPPGTPARREPFDRQRIGSATRRASVRSALMVILVWNLGMMFEPFCDRTLAWVVPFYDTIKTLCLMWFLVTRSLGSQMLFNRFVVPIVSPYEPIIDAAIHASARLLPLAYVLLGWLRIRSGDLYAGLWSQGRGDDAHASATIEEISPLQDRRAVRTENTKPRTPEAAVSTFDRQQPKPRSALQKARVISQRQQHEQRRSSMADQRSSEQEARPSKPAAASPAQKTSSRAPDAAVPSSSPTSDRSPALPTFAFVPPAAIPGTPANPAALLSPPPKLPGHFQFAFIPPPFQDAVDVRQKQAERSINANPASELDVSSRVSAANGTEEASVPSRLATPRRSSTAAPKRIHERPDVEDEIVAPPSRRTRVSSSIGTGGTSTRAVRPSRSSQSLRAPASATGASRPSAPSTTATDTASGAPRTVSKVARANRPESSAEAKGRLPRTFATPLLSDVSASTTTDRAVETGSVGGSSVAGQKRALADEAEPSRRTSDAQRKKARTAPTPTAAPGRANAAGTRNAASAAATTDAATLNIAPGRTRTAATSGRNTARTSASGERRASASVRAPQKPANRVTRSRAKASSSSQGL